MTKFFYQYGHNELVPLNARNSSLLEREFLILCEILKPMLVVLATISFIFLSGSSFLAYFIGKHQFNLISVIFWSLCTVPFIMQMSGIICIGLITWVIPVHYLIYKFNEITHKFSNIQDFSFMEVTANHNKICLKTQSLNEFFCFLIFLLYYFAPLTLTITVYICLSHNVITIVK